MRSVLFTALASVMLLSSAFAADAPPKSNDHRYVIERTFPAGALDGVDAAAKQKVNANNATVGVSWVRSYANTNKTKTYCVYDGPNENAIRKAAKLNNLPVDKVTEVPVAMDGGTTKAGDTSHRYIVVRDSAGAAKTLNAAARKKMDDTNAHFGVQFVTAYASADKTKAYSIYEAPSEAAVRDAVAANGMPVASIEEVPVTLLPN
jgi:opacity protein-like surface antigen